MATQRPLSYDLALSDLAYVAPTRAEYLAREAERDLRSLERLRALFRTVRR
jgi:hypothetical protein